MNIVLYMIEQNIIRLIFSQVQVFYVNEYPESGMGSIVTAKKGTKLSIMVKPFVTISTDRIKHLPLTERFCYFPDEQHLSVSKSYTQKSCLIECRLNYLHRKCGCRPYYFNMLGKQKLKKLKQFYLFLMIDCLLIF